MKYGNAIRLSLLVLVALLVGVAGGMFFSWHAGSATQKSDKLSYVLSYLQNNYVDSLAMDSVINRVLPKVLSELDPHSSYLTAEDFAKANEPLAGRFDGIGVMFNMITDTVLVTNVIAGGPSSKVGVLSGDRIISVNDSIIAGRKMDTDKVVGMLRGKRGSNVKLGIARNGAKADHLTYITVTRGVIPIKSLEASLIIGSDIGYIRFTRFAASTHAEVAGAMQALRDKGAKRFVIDVRGNSGGYLDQAIYLTNEFLPKGKLIVYTQGAHYPRSESVATGQGRFMDVPLVVLVDEGSASAAEILAGGLQDNDRGMIVGRRSFGKGLVQEQVPFADGSAARITIARYYTPLGRSIQKPYIAGDAEGYNMEIARRVMHNELFTKDSIHQNTKEKFVTPGGKILYGGGGIMPDVFVPLDTMALSTYFRDLYAKNLVFRYATKLTEANRQQINEIKDYEELDQFFVGRSIFTDFVKYAESMGVKAENEKQKLQNRDMIVAQIKGYVGRNTPLEENAYFYYMYSFDDTIKRGIEAFLVQ